MSFQITNMENIKNFVNGITGADTQKKCVTIQTSSNMPIPRIDVPPDHNSNGNEYLGKMGITRNRTESESSNASVSFVMSSTPQKDKDPYFWVM